MTSPTPLTVESIMKEFETDIFPSINIGYDGGYHDAQNRDKYIAFFKDRLTILTTHHTKEKEEMVREILATAEDGDATWEYLQKIKQIAKNHNISV